MRYEADDVLVVRDISKHLPPDRAMVACITDYYRFVEATYDYAFKEWRFDQKYLHEKIKFWLSKEIKQ